MEVPHAVRVARPGVRVTAYGINDNLDFACAPTAGCAGSGCNAGTARSNSAARASRRIASCCYHLAGRRFHGHALCSLVTCWAPPALDVVLLEPPALDVFVLAPPLDVVVAVAPPAAAPVS